MINLLHHMVFHSKTRLARSEGRQFNHGFWAVGFFPNTCHYLGRPKISSLNIYVCVVTICFGWFNNKITLTNGFPLPNMPRKQCGHAIEPWVFACWLLSQGMP